MKAESWKDSTVVQAVGGFVAGVALGLVPGGGIGAGALSAAGVLNQGTKAAEIGKSLGEIAGGAALMLFGGGGTVAGAVATVSGVGTAAGVPAMVGSAALVAGGASNIAAGIQGLTQALSTGGRVGGKATTEQSGKGATYKVPKPGVDGKTGAKNAPSWAKGERPAVGESGKDFARRLLDQKYGQGNYPTVLAASSVRYRSGATGHLKNPNWCIDESCICFAACIQIIQWRGRR